MFVVFVEFGVILSSVFSCIVVFMWGRDMFSASVFYLCCIVFSVYVYVCGVLCICVDV